MIIHSNGVKLAVRDFDGSGHDLLLLHGLASTSHMFDLVAPKLTDEFHVVAYDQRGHGESSKPTSGYGFDHMSADAAAVIRGLGSERPLVLGHSWGANVALELGVREPSLVSGLVLLDGGFASMRERMDWKTTKQMLSPPPFAGIHIDDFLGMAPQFFGGEVEFTPEVEAMVRSLVRVDREGGIRPRLSRANHLRILRALWEQDTEALLRRVSVPTLVVATWREDAAADSERTFIALKEAAAEDVEKIGDPVRFQWIEGIHDVPLQRPDAVADLVRSFYRTISASLST